MDGELVGPFIDIERGVMAAGRADEIERVQTEASHRADPVGCLPADGAGGVLPGVPFGRLPMQTNTAAGSAFRLSALPIGLRATNGGPRYVSHNINYRRASCCRSSTSLPNDQGPSGTQHEHRRLLSASTGRPTMVVTPDQIKEHMEVVGNDGLRVGVIDRVEAGEIT